MTFGSRNIEADEPVLYFENVSMAMLTEQNRPMSARGGWGNMPHVIWDDRSEVQFQMVEGVMSNVSMGILLSANVATKTEEDKLLVNMREQPYELTQLGENKVGFYLKKTPVLPPRKKMFILEYSRDVAQRKMYGRIEELNGRQFLSIYKDKECEEAADMDKDYIVDYYYEYGDEALVYTIQKERFNGLFTLEGKFYSKDENEGINYTNILFMPKVRVVSNIGLRLGERADPTVSTFNIIGLPENVGDTKNMIFEITRLENDLDGDI